MFKRILPLTITLLSLTLIVGCHHRRFLPHLDVDINIDASQEASNSGSGSGDSDSRIVEEKQEPASPAKSANSESDSGLKPAASSIAVAEEAAPEQEPAGPKVDIPTTCEIITEAANDFQMTISAPDSGIVNLAAYVKGGSIVTSTKIDFTDKVTKSTIDRECENAKAEEGAQVTCGDRSMSIVVAIDAEASVFPMIISAFKKECEDIKKTGIIKARK